MKKIYLVVIMTFMSFSLVKAQPTAGPTAPTLSPTDVISLFSNSYTNKTVDTWSASWDQADVADVVLGGNNAKLYTNCTVAGIEFTGANSINATSMNYVHIDIWTPNTTPIKMKFVDFGANNAYGGGDDKESIEYTLSPQPTQNGWSSYFIPFSVFTGLTTRANLSQMIFTGTSTTFYVDNIYFSTITGEALPAWSLYWSDEFNVDGAPDNTKWVYDIGIGPGNDGWGNSELQFYTNRTQNVNISNGTLKLTLIKENYNGMNYTSGRIKTQNIFSFKYGKIDVRAKLPSGVGTWPAIWMLGSNLPTAGWPQCGEIDIMEHKGNDMNKIFSTLHYPNNFGANGPSGNIVIADATQFHKYTAEWNETAIKFYVDDVLFYTFNNNNTLPFNQNFFIILNLAFGGSFVGNVYDPNLTAATLEIDYVKVYKNGNVPTISGFNVPSTKLVTDPPFTLTQPTSNSNGAFTYSSSNTAVATVSGNVVTLVGVGTTTISASQAASGTFSSGDISSNLTVNYTQPTAGPAAPTLNASNVISLFSNTYTNRTVNTWSASWDQADLADVVLGGNNAKLYTNCNYAGIEFTGANSINATSMNFLHVDIWTPNLSAISVKLVDFGADNAYGGGDDKESSIQISPQPTLCGWSSYFIPLSSFAALTSRANLSQLLFLGSSTIIYVDNIYFSTQSTLPVIFTNINALQNGNAVNINWSTSYETNNKGFGIEHSTNGINFTQIQFVPANLNSANSNNYLATHKNPVAGTNYYRLAQVDNDGKITYSSVISVKFNYKNTITVYPNPVKTKLTVQLNTISEKVKLIQLISLDGKVVQSVAKPQNSNIVIFDVANIAKGSYFIVTDDAPSIKSTKVIVQ